MPTRSSMATLKIGLVQIQQAEDPATYDKEQALQHAAELIRNADLADLYILPELAPTGYCAHVFEQLDVLAEDQHSESFQVLGDVAKERGCYICFGVPGRHPEGYTIRQVVLDDTGHSVAVYDKHLGL